MPLVVGQSRRCRTEIYRPRSCEFVQGYRFRRNAFDRQLVVVVEVYWSLELRRAGHPLSVESRL